MSTYFIIANILSLIGNTLFTISAIVRNKRKLLLLQSSNHTLSIIAEYMTHAYSAMVQESVSLIRNSILLFIDEARVKLKAFITGICVIVAVSVGVTFNIIFNDNIWYGYLPILGNLVYAICVILGFLIKMKVENVELLIKSGLLINSVLWSIFGYCVKLYPIFIFNIINFILCLISIIRVIIIKMKTKVSQI